MAFPIVNPAIALEASVKDAFFDREKVVKAIRSSNRRKLSRVGSFVRNRVRTDILRRGTKKTRRQNARRDGMPPLIYSHDSFATLKNVLFAYNAASESVVIGPRAVDSLRLKDSSEKYVPGLLEHGGTAVLSQILRGAEWQTISAKAADKPWNRWNLREVKATYAKHPFMGPGLKKEVEAGTLNGLWYGW